ncbi:hypothetical protein GTA08_BOTSDO12235 [Neofusicoccum parvum]|uniref:Putative beige beach domain-containing protein n=1 Tax=Botryosphaeria parva (strain UCR-NP2) TaxID=1287680 RepID=R1GWC0_BOTPV|nr:putative beige beach domain-containing protein [Neofusicoccum parvum UCRNP2]GME64153.1 hypothetical protein GTA08_BOTSDO12235 [Neofusicoccum parvum]
MTYWQTIILSPENLEGNYLRLLCYLLYTKLVSGDTRVRAAAADFWRLMLVQKPAETSQMLNQTTSSNDRKLFTDFMKLTELDNDAFLAWVDDRRSELDNLFFGAMSKSWEEFVVDENRKTEESAKNRSSVNSNAEDDFEFVADPNEGEDGFEDKNRKVMRSLQQGDQSEDAWRLESLRTPEEAPPSMASKWVNAFNPMAQNPATKKWLKGEISNFHYLMLVNTMAGRTFNDLTQYPVFPWILADYTSEELDLNDPKTFRDLSKPMGAQTLQREAEFKERYQTFAEMSDGTNPVFHYGTHYSSAMIVTSYLIRLQPFVQSYLLLQGGSFDHADRLFDSIEKAWSSASKDNMTDVRELIPEFFYLPEFLKNMNGYNFGQKQVTGEKINDVALPPWAKGDPEIFVAKHREALESPYVTKNLQKWIDLVFGYKQQGEAAVEATNVFHYLSYHGAKDLDTIDDPVERLATIGIIHNFGQTPHQVFQKPHPPRGEPQKPKRLDSAAESLTRLPFTLLDAHESVSSLTYHPKQERILCSAAFRINIPPSYDRYMEWGFTDGSVRFYATDSKKLIGLWEHLHQGQISCATFVDGKTLITAGTDCTVAVWNVIAHSKTVDLVPKVCFFGHRHPVSVLATSRAFSTFLSADSSGQVFLWDLNRSEFVRRIGKADAPVSCARINNLNGHIMLCTGSRLMLYTLNGRLLLDQDVCDTIDPDDVVYSCAFYEGVGNEWLEKELILTGHRRGVVNVWHKTLEPGTGEWILELLKRLNHVDPSREDGGNYPGSISCILPMAQTVYTGDDDGKVVSSPYP